jgi:plasmid stability protein
MASPETLEQLKSRAEQHGRSLQGEVNAILESATVFSMDEARQASERWRQRLAGRVTSDSGDLQREDRDR